MWSAATRRRIVPKAATSRRTPNLMLVGMMQVGGVRVAVPGLLMPMPVAVSSYRHRGMDMGMVSVIMGMGMFVFQHLMQVSMLMFFCQVQHHTCHHQRSAA